MGEVLHLPRRAPGEPDAEAFADQLRAYVGIAAWTPGALPPVLAEWLAASERLIEAIEARLSPGPASPPRPAQTPGGGDHSLPPGVDLAGALSDRIAEQLTTHRSKT